MGTQTRADMRTDLWLHLDTRTDLNPTSALGQTRLDLALNKALRHVSMPNVYEHPELQASTTIILALGNRTYSTAGLAPPLWAIAHVYNRTTRLRLDSLSHRQMLDLGIDITGGRPLGPPTQYSRWGNVLFLDFFPGTSEVGNTLDVWYVREPAVIAAAGSATELSSMWDQVIVEGATWYAWMSLGQAERADLARASFASLINEVGGRDSLEATDEGRQFDLEVQSYQEFSR